MLTAKSCTCASDDKTVLVRAGAVEIGRYKVNDASSRAGEEKKERESSVPSAVISCDLPYVLIAKHRNDATC